MRDVNGAAVYKDVCNPITAEFREKLYGDIIEAFNAINDPEKGKNTDIETPNGNKALERRGKSLVKMQ